MATFNENIAVSRIDQLNVLTGEATQVTGSAVMAVRANFPVNSIHVLETLENKKLRFYMGSGTYANRCTLKDKTLVVHEVNDVANVTGWNPTTESPAELPPGSIPFFDIDAYGYDFNGILRTGAITYEMSRMTNSTPKWSRFEEYVWDIISEISIQNLNLTGGKYASCEYYYTASATFDGVNAGANAPYYETVWEDVVPSIRGLAPNSGAFIDRTKPTRFSYTITVSNAFDGTPINHTKKLQWRIAGSETVNEIALTSNNGEEVPAGTFPAGSEIEWRIIDVTEYDITATSPWNTISTNDIEPEAPTNLRPKDTIVDGNTENLFSWTHNSPVGTEATKAELQQSNEGVSWNTFATVNSADNFCVVPANTFTAGVRYGRVRTYDTESEAGAWSEPAQILVKALPLPPAISEIVSKPRASVSWQATDQIGWRVIFIDSAGKIFDSGERYGTEKTYRIDGFMSEGPGRVAVRVANELGLWSETEVELNIINQPPGEIVLSAFTDRNGTTLTWNTAADTAYYIERDGKPIGKGNGSYLDKAGNGVSTYRIRGVKDGFFALSNEVETVYYPDAVEIFDAAINGNIIALYKVRGNIFQEGRSVKGNATYYHFAGAEQPTAYTGNYKSENISFRVTVENEKAHMLDALIDRVCCIKDKTGSKVYGVLDSIGYTVDRFTDLTLSFTAVEYDEEVAYD